MYEENSILGNEILGEIFLSLLYQLMYINFDLQLDNASFLDDTWDLPDYKKLELVPCVDLGIYLGCVYKFSTMLLLFLPFNIINNVN